MGSSQSLEKSCYFPESYTLVLVSCLQIIYMLLSTQMNRLPGWAFHI